MKLSLAELYKELEVVLKDSGFSEELYVLKIGADYVSVQFDMKEAVDYFKVDFEDSHLGKDCIFEYRKDGKRHAAYIYLW